MKFIFRLITTVIVVAVLAAAGVGIYAFMHRGELVEGAITEATGNASVGSIAGKVAAGEDLSDAEIQDLLGCDDETYAQLKKAAQRAGVNITDGTQIKKVAEDNPGKLDVVAKAVDGLQSGKMTVDEAAGYLAQNLKLQ